MLIIGVFLLLAVFFSIFFIVLFSITDTNHRHKF